MTLTISQKLQHAIESYEAPRGFLAVASIGLPTRESVAAQKADLDLWSAAQRDPMDYDGIIERTRGHFAQLVGVSPDRVATGSQTSVITSVIAAAVPAGAEVLCVDGDFSSIVFPFLQLRGVRVRTVPLAQLADSITDDTWLVVFSHIQSATGVVADIAAITSAAQRHGAFTYCDLTQSAGVHPVDASLFDATVCHAYKWLCAPRGVAFLTLGERFQGELTPIQAGWYAGDEVWQSCYGPHMALASTARRFDVSPAWPAWVGAEPTIRMFSELDIEEVWQRVTALGNALCEGLGIPAQHQAIVTWPDTEGSISGVSRQRGSGHQAAPVGCARRSTFGMMSPTLKRFWPRSANAPTQPTARRPACPRPPGLAAASPRKFRSLVAASLLS